MAQLSVVDHLICIPLFFSYSEIFLSPMRRWQFRSNHVKLSVSLFYVRVNVLVYLLLGLLPLRERDAVKTPIHILSFMCKTKSIIFIKNYNHKILSHLSFKMSDKSYFTIL